MLDVVCIHSVKQIGLYVFLLAVQYRIMACMCAGGVGLIQPWKYAGEETETLES